MVPSPAISQIRNRALITKITYVNRRCPPIPLGRFQTRWMLGVQVPSVAVDTNNRTAQFAAPEAAIANRKDGPRKGQDHPCHHEPHTRHPLHGVEASV